MADEYPLRTTKQCLDALRLVANVLEWQESTIEDVHNYAHRFGGTPGCNVYDFLLRDALAMHGLTLADFRSGAASQQAGKGEK